MATETKLKITSTPVKYPSEIEARFKVKASAISNYPIDKAIENAIAKNPCLEQEESEEGYGIENIIEKPKPIVVWKPARAAKPKRKLPTPPNGYRLLKLGETILETDLYFTYVWRTKLNEWKKAKQYSYAVGYKFTQSCRNQGIGYCRKIERVKYTKAQKENAIIYLRKSRAFNEDSAIAVKSNFILYFSLAKNKMIGMVDESRFFYKKT